MARIMNDDVDEMIENMTHPGRIHGAGDGMLNLVWQLANEQTENHPTISPRQQFPIFEIGAGDGANEPIENINEPEIVQAPPLQALQPLPATTPPPPRNLQQSCIQRFISSVRCFFLEVFRNRESLKGCTYAFILAAVCSGIFAVNKLQITD